MEEERKNRFSSLFQAFWKKLTHC